MNFNGLAAARVPVMVYSWPLSVSTKPSAFSANISDKTVPTECSSDNILKF